MIPRYGVDMTEGEAEACVIDLVRRLGFRWAMASVIQGVRNGASEKQAEAEKDFQLATNVAVTAGLEKEGETDD